MATKRKHSHYNSGSYLKRRRATRRIFNGVVNYPITRMQFFLTDDRQQVGLVWFRERDYRTCQRTGRDASERGIFISASRLPWLLAICKKHRIALLNMRQVVREHETHGPVFIN